ncbi:MAG TPA: HAD-IIA family hydrolase [Candidatus Hydrogenedentes bacterium]|nr:HAD-IIA family hydrolase [Candidatus Hydrogenedentota bacterium]
MLNDLNAFLLDMDGTVYLGHAPIPGAAEFVQFLRATQRRYLFFTNNPSGNAEQYSDKLCRMGIHAAPDNILTAGEATVEYIRLHTTFQRVFALATPSFEDELRRAGIEVTTEAPEAVVLAFDKTLTYAKLETACLLLRKGLPYLATNPDKACPENHGYIPDCGSIAALLEASTGRTPLYLGKPNPWMVRMGMTRLCAVPGETAMVGDRLYTDMEMAFQAGIASILVLSGETQPCDLEHVPRRPDFVFPSVKELHQALGE